MKTSLTRYLFIFLFLSFSYLGTKAQSKVTNWKIANIPYQLEILNEPVSCTVTGESIVEIAAKGKTNLFNNPNGKYYVQDAPMLVFKPDSDFVLSARATGNLKEIYDVMALVVYQDKDVWAKLCFENSVEKIPTIVSVVTRKYSDDCNSMPADSSFAYLSIVKKGNLYSFFYSKDEEHWKMIRNFRLDTTKSIKVGFAVHDSRGNGFAARFSNIKYLGHALDEMKKL